MKQDNVNHPSHYTWLRDKCGIEVIDIVRHMDFCTGNALKYLLRAGHKQDASLSDKDKEIEDLKKAIWYINDRINQIRNSDYPKDYDFNQKKLNTKLRLIVTQMHDVPLLYDNNHHSIVDRWNYEEITIVGDYVLRRDYRIKQLIERINTLSLANGISPKIYIEDSYSNYTWIRDVLDLVDGITIFPRHDLEGFRVFKELNFVMTNGGKSEFIGKRMRLYMTPSLKNALSEDTDLSGWEVIDSAVLSYPFIYKDVDIRRIPKLWN